MPVSITHVFFYLRYSDFLYGLPMSKLPSAEADLDSGPLSSADRVRLVHAYITSTPHEGGLGIIPDCREWDHVQSVMALHNHEFNDQWIRLWTRHRIASVELEKVRDQVCALPSFFPTVNLNEDLVWRFDCPLFLLPDRIYTRPHFPVSIRGPFLLLWHTVFHDLFNTLIHMVHCICRMVASSRTHSFRSMVHSRVLSCGETKGRLHHWFSLVEERSKKDGKHTCHIAVCQRPFRCFDRHLYSGGVCNSAIQGSWASHCSKSSQNGLCLF